jgi:hypothetical protein
VQLLGEDHATVVLTWRFLRARPVSLSYSPLRALDDGILIETVELEFDAVEMSVNVAGRRSDSPPPGSALPGPGRRTGPAR